MHCRQILAHMNPCGPSVQKEVQPRMAKISANYEVVFIMDDSATRYEEDEFFE